MIHDTQLFASPRSKPARRLAELRDRRRQLQHQQRDALLAREQAEREHDRLADLVRGAEARALALHEPANTKTDRARLAKAERQVDEHSSRAEALSRALSAIDDEMSTVARDSYDELLSEATDNHAAAANRAAAAIAELHAAHAEARAAFAAAQTIHANAGHSERSAWLRETRNVEQIVRDGALASLVDERDRAAA